MLSWTSALHWWRRRPRFSGPLNYANTEVKQAQRKEVLGRDYLARKIYRTLNAGGFGSAFGKWAAELIYATDSGEPARYEQASFLQDATKEFDMTQACYLGKPEEGADIKNLELANMLPNYVSKFDSVYTKKTKDLEKTMGKKGWKSAMVNFDATCALAAGFTAAESELQLSAGAQPWVVCYKRNAWRYGPQNFPLPGCACFVFSKAVALIVHMVDAEGVIAEGLAVADIKSFLDSPSGGADFCKENCVQVHLQPVATLYIPAGKLPVVTYYSEEAKDTHCAYGCWLMFWGCFAGMALGVLCMTSLGLRVLSGTP